MAVNPAVGDLAGVLAGFGAGAGLGAAYLVGLWWTVRRMAWARRPGLLLLASLGARLGLLLGGLWWVADGHWQRLAAGLAGFVVVRALLVRRWGPESRARRAT